MDRQLSHAIGERFLRCLTAVHDLHDAFLREEKTSDALFDAIRTAMIACAAHLSRSAGSQWTDSELRAALHLLLDKAIEDYQFNERLYVTGGD